jgi:hypothetical protein
MPWGRYLEQARIIGENIGLRTLERNFWEEVSRSRLVEEESFSGMAKRNEVQH